MKLLKRLLNTLLNIRRIGNYRFIQFGNSFIVWTSGNFPSPVHIFIFLIDHYFSSTTLKKEKDISGINIFELSRMLAEIDRINLPSIATLSKKSEATESALVFQQTLVYQAYLLPMLFHLKSLASNRNIGLILQNIPISQESINWIMTNIGIKINNHICHHPSTSSSMEAKVTLLKPTNEIKSNAIVIIGGRIKDINTVYENISPDVPVILVLKPNSKIEDKSVSDLQNLYAIIRLPSLEKLGHDASFLKLILWKDQLRNEFRKLKTVSDVYGPLERSPLAGIFTILKEELNFKIHNFQHGLLPQPFNLDLLTFDTFYYLYDEAKEFLSHELKNCNLIKQKTVSTPFSKKSFNAPVKIVFFNQPIKGIFCTQDEMIKTYKILEDICHQSQYKVELSIKQHPSEKELISNFIQIGKNFKNVKFFGPDNDSSTLIKNGDIIITHSSSILLDAIQQRKIVVLTCNSFTFNSLFSSLKSDYIHLVEHYNQFIKLLSEIYNEHDHSERSQKNCENPLGLK
jgi:hypothetical protein